MIELYTGTPGSGKSLNCARKIYMRLRFGRHVVANFDINMADLRKYKRCGEFLYIDNSDLNPEDLMYRAVQTHRRNGNGNIIEGQTLLIIDECQILFNSRDWGAKERMKWCSFFAQHRKYGYDIILITQFDRMIDRQIRALVEYEIIHRKVSNFKLMGFFIGLLAGGSLFVAVKRWYGLREKVDAEFFRCKRKYARLYNSYAIFTTDAPAAPTGEEGGRGSPAEPEDAAAAPEENALPEAGEGLVLKMVDG